jgi:carbon-monoxide dehydrogenase large subunit
MSAVGTPLKRKEDPRMITGRGQVHGGHQPARHAARAIIRSTEAHAAITSIDTDRGQGAPGVVAVLTGEDMAGDFQAGHGDGLGARPA